MSGAAMTTKWTRGPWSVRSVQCDDPGCALCASEFPNFAVSGKGWDELATVYGRADEPDGQAEGAANARLIAAAPELYEATLALLACLANGGHDPDCDAMSGDEFGAEDEPAKPCSCGYVESLKAARAALKKATGEP